MAMSVPAMPAFPGLRLASFAGLTTTLLDQLRWGFYHADNAQDVLLAREQLIFHLYQVAPDYSGYIGCTVDGVLVYSDTEHGIIDAVADANPPGRLGYWHWIGATP